MSGVFVTGTDTGIGKTWTTLAIMAACQRAGLHVAGMKPVASGCSERQGVLVNDDALAIQALCTSSQPYDRINPVALLPPIAPHIAATAAGIDIQPNKLIAAFQVLTDQHDLVVVEGIGGWRVPLGEHFSTTDLVRQLRIPVVLVVGLRLGCINHALLTAETVRHDGHSLLGWVANGVDKTYESTQETLATLDNRIKAPMLGYLPYSADLDVGQLAKGLKINEFLACLSITSPGTP